MKDVDQMMPNVETHPEFADVLCKAREKGVHLAAYDCIVSEDEIRIDKEIPVVLPGDEKGRKNNGEDPISILSKLPDPLIRWFRGHKRDLPWRNEPSAYHVWVSEIMLQQTRVEAVKPFYARFLEAFPTIRDLAEAQEEKLLKLWEGLGYYNRVRNMQKAARQIMEMYDGEIPQIMKNPFSYRDRQLHGRSHQLLCLWYPKAGGGRKCFEGFIPYFGR